MTAIHLKRNQAEDQPSPYRATMRYLLGWNVYNKGTHAIDGYAESTEVCNDEIDDINNYRKVAETELTAFYKNVLIILMRGCQEVLEII